MFKKSLVWVLILSMLFCVVAVSASAVSNGSTEQEVGTTVSVADEASGSVKPSQKYYQLPNGETVAYPDATVSVKAPVVLTPEGDDYMVWPSGDDTVDRPLQIVMNFRANQTEEEASATIFGNWKCDFYLSFTGLAEGSIVADGCYLAGNYGSFGWIVIPADGLELEEGIDYPVVAAYDANLKYAQDICGSVKDFTAAIYVAPAILEANPDFKVSLSLKMTDPENADNVITIGEPAVYDKYSLGLSAGVAQPEENGFAATANEAAVEAAKTALAELGVTETELANAKTAMEITIVSVPDASGKIVYNVAPTVSAGNKSVKVSTFEAPVTFRLPVNSGETKTFAKVYHEGELLGTYAIVDESGSKYVEVSSKNFSEFAVEPTDTALVIMTADQLKAFADRVNGGESFQGKTVELGANIDLEYTAVVIGTKASPFKGTFDGKGYTVANLTIYEDGSDSDYFASTDDCLGLFGVINTPAVIKNVTVSDPYIVGSSYVGGIVGMAYTGRIENCHVVGKIDIEGFYMVGGITGHGYAKIYDCSVIGEEGWDYSYIGATYKAANLEGDNVGGIVGHNAETNVISGCTVKNVTVSGTRKVGGIVGITAQNGTVTGCTVSGVTVETTATEEYAADNAKTMSIGGLIGQFQAAGNNAGTVSDCVIEDVTFENENNVTVSIGAVTGGLRGSSNSTVKPADTIIMEDIEIDATSMVEANNTYLTSYVAKIGNAYFATLQEAINASVAGDEIILISDVVLADTLTIPAGKAITLNLAGYTVSQTKACTENYNMIYNKGALTITGNGKISFTDTGAGDSSFGWGSYTIRNEGTLVVENGIIENLSEQNAAGSVKHMYCAIFQYSGSTTINGGTVSTPSYRSVRLWKGDMTLNGGNFEGQVWVQSVDNTATLTINGGTFAPRGVDGSSVFVGNVTNAGVLYDVAFTVTGGTFTTKIGANNAQAVAGAIKGGTFTEAAKNYTNADLLGEGFIFGEANADGNFGVVVDPAYGKVAKIGDTYYETLADALAAAKAGDEVTLYADVALSADVTLPAGIILNGNGKSITGATVWAGGNLTFKGYTKMETFNAGYDKPVITIGEGATLEMTTGRMVIGHGATFNIVGTITDAKTANVADLVPSLIIPGASFTGAGVNFNVTNAYVKFTAYCSSKNGSANGTFNINVENSIWEQTNTLVFSEPTSGKDPTFNFTLKDSVLNSTSHLVFGVTKGEIVFDNSNVNVGAYRQLENRSTLTIKNGSVVYAAHATSSNAKNPGTTIVENATYMATGEFTGSDVGIGTLILKKGANVTMGKITKSNIVVDATDMTAGEIGLTANLSDLAGTVSTINSYVLEAMIVDGKLVLAERTLLGSGTEADPYIINNVSDLIFFRDSVNAGETKYNAPGVWVALAADIDLEGAAAWTVGIGDGHTWSFDGCFDGKGHTIKNLVMNPYADSENPETAYICGGLFGYTYGAVTIKDLVLENVTVETEAAGHNVGALVGFANNKDGKLNVSGVTVKNVTIDTPNANGVGTIVGYSYRAMGTIENCTVDGATITGARFVGGITGYSYDYAIISGCTVKNATITGNKGVGGIAGLANGTNQVRDNTVEGVTVTANTANVGYVVGEIGSEGIVVENNTAAEPQVGGSYSTGKPVQAKIGNKYYTTLAKALEAASAGDEIVLLTSVVVNAGETLTLDKAVTITYTSNVPGEDMITNRGTLIVDGATLVYVNTDTTASNVTVSTISSEAGSVLEIKSGEVRNDSANNGAAGIYAFAIDLLTNGSLGDVTATISGGKVISTNYMAIRQFNNGTACKNTLTVEGGYIYGAKRAIQIHMDNNAGILSITGGEIEAGNYALCLFPKTSTNIAITGGTFVGTVYSGTNGIISGGTFDEAVEEAYCAEGYIPTANGDGTFGVKVGVFTVRNTTTGVGYETLAEAVAAAVNGDTIVVLANVELTKGLTVAANKEIVLDLAGHTVSMVTDDNALTSLILNNGSLTITDSSDAKTGKLSYKYTGTNSSDAYNTVETAPGSVLTVKGGTIENLSANCLIAYAIDGLTNANGGDVIVNVEGGVITSMKQAIRIFANSTTNTGYLNISGGTMVGRVIIQNASAKANKAALNITGGIFNVNSYKSDVLYVGGSQSATVDMVASVSGGTFNGAITDTHVTGFITGGTFGAPVAEEFCAAGYIPTANGDGTFGVKVGTYVARNTTTGVGYETLQAALNAAQAGDTILVFEGTYALPALKAGITIEGVGEVLFEGTLSGTLEDLTLKNIHIKGSNAQRWAYAKGDLVFENVTFEATGVYALHFDGITAGATLLYKDCTIIGWAAMSGSPASCVFDGCTIKGNGSYGLIRTYFDATIENCTFDVSNVNPNDAYQDGIHAVDATVTVNNSTNVNGDMKDIIDTSKVGYIVLDGESIHFHKFVQGETVAPDFGVDGYTVYTCPCGEVEHRDIVAAKIAAAQIGNVKYESLAEALAAAATGDTVTVLVDVALAEGLVIAEDDVIILDLAGKKISRNTDVALSTATIINNGNLTITDSIGGGKITAFAQNPDTADVPYYANNTITNCGVLTVKGGTIENSTGDNARAAFPIDNNSTLRDAILYIEGGEIVGRGAIRQFANSTSHKNKVYVSGGSVNGSSYAVWVQNPGSGDPLANLKISGGTVAKILFSPSANFDAAITGGIVKEVAIWEADTTNTDRNPAGFITGGTFGAPVAEEFCAAGYGLKDNGDGTYDAHEHIEGTVVIENNVAPDFYVEGSYDKVIYCTVCGAVLSRETVIVDALIPGASVNGTYYATLQDAINAAQAGDTIQLHDDQSYTGYLIIDGITFDLNGHELTVNGAMIALKGSNLIDSAVEKGKLKVASKNSLVLSDVEYPMLPIWMEDGYVFAEALMNAKGEAVDEDSFKVQFRPVVLAGENNAENREANLQFIEDILANGAADNDITIEIIIRCMKNGVQVEMIHFVLTEEIIENVYTNNKMVSLTVNGATAEIADEYIATLVVSSERGVSLENSAFYTFTPPASSEEDAQ